MTETAPPDARRPAAAPPPPAAVPPTIRPAPPRPRPARRRRGLGSAAACLLLSAVVASAGCGCKRDPSVGAPTPDDPPPRTAPNGKPMSFVRLGGQPFFLEVVASDADRNLGLMYRKSMPADCGMAFVFAEDKELRFWMHNTSIPLDIVYLDAGGKVVSVKPMAPFDETGVTSDGPSRYAIELNLGTAARVGLKAGDVVKLPPAIQHPPGLE